MNKEVFEQRIAMINNELSIVKANFSKLEGHLEEAKYWLKEIERKESEYLNNENIA